MKKTLDGNAIVYCEGAFNTTNGKTAHGLVRFTKRYEVLAVIDSRYAGKDAGKVIDDRHTDIPVVASIDAALQHARSAGREVRYLVVGLAPDGGKLSDAARSDIKKAITLGLNIDCGLHDFLSDDPEIVALASKHGVQIRDIRKTPPRNQLHFFEGKIEQVDALVVAILGTDSAIGKRTTAWLLVNGLEAAGYKAEMIGTGQTAWMQGARYSLIMDSLINDFVSGEIEHAVYSAWAEQRPDVIVIEGQGSLLNPAYPGGFEILAAGRPDVVILQHAPKRKVYDGFPNFPMHPLSQQIEAVELIGGKPVIGITINHERMTRLEINQSIQHIERTIGLPAFDVLANDPKGLVDLILTHLKTIKKEKAHHDENIR
jgi:uncharacterized NAD-dependent epimerase/dehydratase family protein